jgi:hypothetical protein
MPQILLIVLGILVVAIILLAAAVAIGTMTLRRRVTREVAEMFERSQEFNPDIVTQADVEGLPEPVQRWLSYSGVIGRERAITVRLRQKGFFRQKQDADWMPFQAEEYYTTQPPAFIWHATIKASPFLWIAGRDRYHAGKGNMLIKLLSLITVADARGEKLDQGTLLRYLNEIMWFPSAALSDYIHWEAIDAGSAKATMSYQGVTASAVFHIDERGRLTNMVAERYRAVDGEFVLDTWSTPIGEYREFNGVRIPTQGEGVWNLSSGDFSYIRLEVIGIDYNNPAAFPQATG